jgi:hypothetical protein
MIVKRLIDKKEQAEEQPETPSVESHPAVNPQQFGDIINVDFKNRKKLD